MRIMIGLAATACLALAGCGKSGDGGGNSAAAGGGGNASASAASPSAPAGGGGGGQLRPGLYETAVELSVTGLPPAMAKAMGATKKTGRTCITPQEAARPNGDLFSGEKHKGCTYADNVFAGGQIRGSISCTGEKGQGKMTMTMAGTYSSESFDVRTQMAVAGGGATMNMAGHSVGRRIGDCSGDEDES
jgi:hypothetical protein